MTGARDYSLNMASDEGAGAMMNYTVTIWRPKHGTTTIQMIVKVFQGEKILYQGFWFTVLECKENSK
jgi:hypothetical protein